MKDNIFQLGDHCHEEAVTFAPNGHDLVFTGNTFQNKPATIVVDPTCTRSTIEGNLAQNREEARRFQSWAPVKIPALQA